MHHVLKTVLLLFVVNLSVKSQDMPTFGTMRICTHPNFEGVCHDQIIATPANFCNNLAMQPPQAAQSALPGANTYCTFWTEANCIGSFVQVGPSGHPALDAIYTTTSCNIVFTN